MPPRSRPSSTSSSRPRKHRKTNHASALCPTWIMLNTCNVNIAKDRGWFKTYVPFPSRVDFSHMASPTSNYLPVLGIGSVEIPTKRSPNLTGTAAHGTITLQEVLHVPDILCNILGAPLYDVDNYEPIVSQSSKSKGTIKDSQGKNVAYFCPHSPLLAIKIRGPPSGPTLGPHALQRDKIYMLGCEWEFEDQKKWVDYKIENGMLNNVSQDAGVVCPPPYSIAEKKYLKEKFRSEYYFLRDHGLKIYDEGDRADGRSLLRALMREELLSHDDDEDEVEKDLDADMQDAEEEEGSDDEWDPEGHQADYHFSHAQLEWIEKHYRNSENFMLSYGLKFYDMDDVDEAKAIADAMMDDSDEGDDAGAHMAIHGLST